LTINAGTVMLNLAFPLLGPLPIGDPGGLRHGAAPVPSTKQMVMSAQFTEALPVTLVSPGLTGPLMFTAGCVGVRVGVLVGVTDGVLVCVRVGVIVGVLVGVRVAVLVGVFVGVPVCVRVGVLVGVPVGVAVGVRVGVDVGV
jgi:hypothetical protein